MIRPGAGTLVALLCAAACGDDLAPKATGASTGAPASTSPATMPPSDSESTAAAGSGDRSTTTGRTDSTSANGTAGTSPGTDDGSSKDESTGAAVDPNGPYEDCVNLSSRACPTGATCFRDDPVSPSVGVCTPSPCRDANECAPADTGRAVPACLDLDDSGQGQCALACEATEQCPHGMVCFDATLCAYALLPTGTCVDVDLGFALPTTSSGTVLGARDDHTPSCTFTPGEDLTFEWTAPAAGAYRIATVGSSFNTVLTALQSCDGVELACNDNANASLAAALVLSLDAAETIVIVLDALGTGGEYSLSIESMVFDGNCCAEHGEAGCDVVPIEDCVCALDSYCCLAQWDDLCVDKAIAECAAVCAP